MKVGVHRLAMASPGDITGLQRLLEDGSVDPAAVVACIGKTEGNGGANDFTRALATLRVSTALGSALGVAAEEAAARVALVWSGGCEGVLSPHMTVFTRADSADAGPSDAGPSDAGPSDAGPSDAGPADAGIRPRGRLAISVQRTRHFRPEEVGRMAEVTEVAAATRRALHDLGVTGTDVHYVQVKGPLLTPAGIADAASRGAPVVTTDPNRSKAYARGATALGVAIGLGEVSPRQVTEEAIAADMGLYSAVASTSAGGELTDCEIVVFANSPRASGPYRVGHAVLRDAVDVAGVRAALDCAGLTCDGDLTPEQRGRVAAVFAKAEAPPGGSLRGYRTTMLSDADINYERHARAAVGAVIASVTGDPRIFVSGGTEHQAPVGQAPIAAIVRVDD
jgi:cyanuric acid amidohydrolase